MPANTSPIFGLTPNISSGTITQTGANTSSTGTGTLGTTIFKVFTSGLNGSFVQKVRFLATAASPLASTATTVRIFISTVGTGSTTATDTTCIGEMSLPIINAANATNASNYYDFPINFAIGASEFIHVSMHTAQVNAVTFSVTVIGSDY